MRAAEKIGNGRASRLTNFALLALKLAVSGACLWYASRNVQFREIIGAAGVVDYKWALLATLILTAQLPLVGIRWAEILDALDDGYAPVSRVSMMAMAAVGVFFGQVLPNVAGDTMRVWLLANSGRSWRQSIASVLIDRGVGIGVLCALSFAILLFPSAFTALGTYRHVAIEVFGAAVVLGISGIVAVTRARPWLSRWRPMRWAGYLAAASYQVLFRSRSSALVLGIAVAIHFLTILAVWVLGRGLGLVLPVADAAVLFVVMSAVSLVPITIGGWGVRELAVTALLGAHGVRTEQALLFSICFGIVLLLASLPGAIAWPLCNARNAARDGRN